MICDFCSTPNPRWSFRARECEIDYSAAVMGRSDGLWAACDDCAGLIVMDARQALAERAVTITRALPYLPRETQLQVQLWAHGLFFDHRLDGPPQRTA